MTPPAARAADPRPDARVAVLARQGKFLVAEPFFGPGPRVVVSRDKRAAVGDLVLLGSGAGRQRPRAGPGGRWSLGGWAGPTSPAMSSRR